VRLIEGRPVYQGGRDHTSHRLVYRGLTESRTVVLLATISAALGASSLAYSVLDNWRITLIGVLLTFALLVQFASFLADIQRRPPAERPRAPMFLQALVFRPRRLIEMLVDSALITASFFTAYLLHVSGSGTEWQKHMFTVSLPVLLAARYAVFIPAGLYRGVWRYVGAQDAARILAAVVVSELIAFGFVSITSGPFADFPQSIFVVDALICGVLIVASRFAERALFRSLDLFRTRGARRRTLIVGAGREGRSVLRELRETPGEVVVGFLDDDPGLRGRRLQGATVLGSTDEIERIIATKQPDAVLVTIPAAERGRLEAIVSACAEVGVECRFVRRRTDLDPLDVLDGVVVE
jgi:UDP-GlcNAc:undecaprenyl-phosphate GlcNAc-1-phosphate transferase